MPEIFRFRLEMHRKVLDLIEEFVDQVLADDKFPLGMGGEHLVSWPVIKAMYKKYPDLAIIHMDAHTDLRENYEGESLSHSTPIRKAAGLIGPTKCFFFWHSFWNERRI